MYGWREFRALSYNMLHIKYRGGFDILQKSQKLDFFTLILAAAAVAHTAAVDP